MMLTLLAFQLAFPAGIAVARFTPCRRCVTQSRLDTLTDRSFHGNAVVMMVLHPAISKQLSGLVECAWYDDQHVLAAHKLLSCGLPECWVTALTFMILYTLGIPVYVFLSLRAYLSPQGKARRQRSPMLERYKARLGFICGKYEPDFCAPCGRQTLLLLQSSASSGTNPTFEFAPLAGYYELLEMARKTLLMAATSFLPRGAQLRISPCCQSQQTCHCASRQAPTSSSLQSFL